MDQNDAIMQDQLMHYGVLGMRWGRRKDRSGVSSSGGKTAKGDSDKAQARRMSNKELRSRVNRLRLEKEFATLSKETRPGTKPVQIDKAVKALGTVAAVTGSALTIYKNVNKAMEIASKVK